MTSETSTVEETAGAPAPAPSPTATSSLYKRHFRNYLINAEYQLKTTAVMVLISIVLSGGLGWLVYRQTAEANRVFKVQAETAQMLQQKGLDLGPDDILALQVYEQFKKQDRNMMLVLSGFGVFLAIVLSGIGIILTHKVAGPLYKITLYLDRIRDGRLGSVYDLRKGDQLRDFFEHFKEMHGALRARAQAHLDGLETILQAGKIEPLDAESAAKLRQIAQALKDELA